MTKSLNSTIVAGQFRASSILAIVCVAVFVHQMFGPLANASYITSIVSSSLIALGWLLGLKNDVLVERYSQVLIGLCSVITIGATYAFGFWFLGQLILVVLVCLYLVRHKGIFPVSVNHVLLLAVTTMAVLGTSIVITYASLQKLVLLGFVAIVALASVFVRQHSLSRLLIVPLLLFAVVRQDFNEISGWLAISAIVTAVVINRLSVIDSILVIGILLMCSLIDLRAVNVSWLHYWQIRQQSDVELLEIDDLPTKRMEAFCVSPDAANERIVVTPHAPDSHATVFDTNTNSSRRIELNGEAPDMSVQIGNEWIYVDAGSGALESHDIATGAHRTITDNVTPTNAYYMDLSDDQSRVLISHDLRSHCTGIELATGDAYATYMTSSNASFKSQCSFLGQESIIYTGEYFSGVVKDPSQILRDDTPKIPEMFFQHYYWREHESVLVPSFWTGVVREHLVRNWRLLGQYESSYGVRSALGGCGHKDYFVTWNYVSGDIELFRRGKSQPIKRWETGPVLRTVNWGCDCDHILAVTEKLVANIDVSKVIDSND